MTARILLLNSQFARTAHLEVNADLPNVLATGKTFKFGRDEVVEALNYLASGQHIGKVCIDF
jgi:hypothetical protein